MATTMRDRTALIRPVPETKIDTVATCCHAALIVNHDGTYELAHEVWCHVGTYHESRNGTRNAECQNGTESRSGTRNAKSRNGTDGGTNNGTR